MTKIKIIAFDADDTLWINEPLFINTRERCEAILAPYIDPREIEERLYATEMKNLHLFGYGIKGFVLSMIETAIQLSYGNIPGREIQQIIDMGKEMIRHPIQLIPKVRNVLQELAQQYELMVITKGDLFDQESKIARSGLAEFFNIIEIVSDKSEDTYAKIIRRYQININEFVMVGNSLKSDILPVCNLGASAVHIPFHTTWQHEEITAHQSNHIDYHEIKSITQLPELLDHLNTKV
ncbi:HAD family hydrolase [Fulvivirgaceae bacterium BMA12]|uniref:HAD family hydrolase n=1 Tax=Agaribacillus aureus TaxID=3051825 RepID=A0ABT8L189_9BACT|nr:HAD family hydrolase [Fulvivirgaceae bacterium BMA12]